MKTVLAMALFFIIGLSLGAGAGAFKIVHDFEAMAGITWKQYTAGYDSCAKEAQEPCNMYGGFAPLSMFSK